MTRPAEQELVDVVLSVYDITTATSEAVAPALERYGLTFTTAFALWAIAPGEQAPTMSVLASRLHCSPQNVSFLCGQLETRGMIQRDASREDARSRLVRLTDAGAEIRASVLREIASESPLARLTQAQLVALRRLLMVAMR